MTLMRRFEWTRQTNPARASVRRSRSKNPTPQGQAALLVAESKLHILVEAGVIGDRQALMAARSAAEVKIEVAMVTGESRGRMQESLDLLSRIQVSLETDS